jgi:DNA-binding transcriptional MerR regulator
MSERITPPDPPDPLEAGVEGLLSGVQAKVYYSISEVCEKTGVEPHVLRYWEKEFGQLRPKKNRAGNRAYRDRDIEIVRRIKTLLYDEQYAIAGAKKKLTEEPLSIPSPTAIASESLPNHNQAPTFDKQIVLHELRLILGVLTGT